MTVLFRNGFESNDFSAWSGNLGTSSVQAIIKHHGNYAMKGIASQDTAYFTFPTPPSHVYCRAYVYINVLPSNENFIDLTSLSDAGYTNNVNSRCYNNGGIMKWGLVVPSGNSYFAATIKAQQWYCIEIRRKVGAGTGIGALWIDGKLIDSKVAETINNDCAYCFVGNGYSSEALTVYLDCAVLADAYIGCERRFLPLTRNMNPRFQSRTLQHM